METESNFEKLKREMREKREKAQVQFENTNDDKNINANIGTISNANIDSNVCINVNNDTNVNVNNNVNKNVNIDSDTNINTNQFILEIEEEPPGLKRATYYLKPMTIKKIEEVSKETNIGKSELVQRILEGALEKLVIKKK